MDVAVTLSSRKQVILSACNGVRSWYLLEGWEMVLPLLLPLLVCTLGIEKFWPAMRNRRDQGEKLPPNENTPRTNQEVVSEREAKKLRLLEVENKLLMEKVVEMEVALKKFL